MNKLLGLLLLMSMVSCSSRNEPENDNPEDLLAITGEKKLIIPLLKITWLTENNQP